MRIIIFSLLVPLLSACISINNDPSGYRPGLIPIYSANVESDGVHIVVDSHGCTTEDSFNVVTFRDGGSEDSNWYHVRFERLNVDLCHDFQPDGVELVYSFTRLGLPADANIMVDNPTNL